MSALRLSVLFALTLALAIPGIAAGKRKPPPPPPPDSAADCTFVAEPSIDDYLVLASLLVGVRCESTKQRIDVTATEFTRDGVSVPMLPVGAERRTCTGANACFVAIDLFSYDNPSRSQATSCTARAGSALSAGGCSGPAPGASTTRGSDSVALVLVTPAELPAVDLDVLVEPRSRREVEELLDGSRGGGLYCERVADPG
jgi:hypothetical protein